MTPDGEPSCPSALGHALPHWWLIADAAALVIVSALSATTMTISHRVTDSLWLAVILGMIAAMGVQMALAFAAGLALGSIETQVPATIGGMLAAMAVCVAGSVLHLTATEGFAVGMATGLAVFLWLDRYRRACDRDLAFGRGGV